MVGSDLECVTGLAMFHSDGMLQMAIGREPTVRDRYLAWLDARAVALVDWHWRMIERVALALIEHRELPGHRVVELMSETTLDHPPLASYPSN